MVWLKLHCLVRKSLCRFLSLIKQTTSEKLVKFWCILFNFDISVVCLLVKTINQTISIQLIGPPSPTGLIGCWNYRLYNRITFPTETSFQVIQMFFHTNWFFPLISGSVVLASENLCIYNKNTQTNDCFCLFTIIMYFLCHVQWHVNQLGWPIMFQGWKVSPWPTLWLRPRRHSVFDSSRASDETKTSFLFLSCPAMFVPQKWKHYAVGFRMTLLLWGGQRTRTGPDQNWTGQELSSKGRTQMMGWFWVFHQDKAVSAEH